MSRKNVEIVVHIDETLSQPDLDELECSLCDDYGIEKVHINPTRRHLMLVDFSPENINSMQVLDYVKNKGVHAELIGGI
ncbi:MAG: heavy-metal-associated domain-containing protein [Gammaproteobacteria bacterium]|nr:heavy-metal-associated domain-containing protein [Gammaproteobacteria bacterium]